MGVESNLLSRRNFYDKRIAQEVDGDILGAEFEGYRFRISGGNDKQGFPMLQGILTDERVRLLLTKGTSFSLAACDRIVWLVLAFTALSDFIPQHSDAMCESATHLYPPARPFQTV